MEAKFSEFRKSDKSLKHEFQINLKILSLTCALLALWQHPYIIGGWEAGSSHFTVTNIFVAEFGEFSEDI